MSGPGDRPDDPDEVTLWAGRLRGWAAHNAPSTARSDDDGVDDATLRPGTDRARDVAAAGPEDLPVDELDDATLRSPSRDTVHEPDDATVVARPRGPVDEPDDATVLSPTRDTGHEPDDATILARPRGPEDEPDDATVVSRPAPGDEPTIAVAPARAPLDELDETTRPRVAVTPRAEAVDDDTVRREAPDDSGDTRAGTRRARRSAAAAAAAGANADADADVVAPGRPSPSGSRLPEATRDARVPVALEREIYRPRADAPVRVERSAPRPSAPPHRDAAAVRPRTTRRAAWRALLVGVAVVVVLAAVAVAAIVLLG